MPYGNDRLRTAGMWPCVNRQSDFSNLTRDPDAGFVHSRRRPIGLRLTIVLRPTSLWWPRVAGKDLRIACR